MKCVMQISFGYVYIKKEISNEIIFVASLSTLCANIHIYIALIIFHIFVF